MNKGCLLKLLVCLLVLVVLIAGSFLLLNPENKTLDDATRASLPGSFIQLSDGVTHYTLTGPENGQVVVLVHGFSVPADTWERNISDLTAAGFRVLNFDLYGRGYSDRPNEVYNLDLFVRQINDLITALKIQQPVDIAGVSMGGYIVAGFADQYPQKVKKVILISPQVETMGADPRLQIVTMPYIGDYIFTVFIARTEILDSSNAYSAYLSDSDLPAKERVYMQYKGIRRALISTLKNMTGDPFQAYTGLGKLGLPVELLWGDQDTTIPIANAQKVIADIPQVSYSVIPGAGHLSCYEEPAIVDPLMISFLSK